MDEQHVKELDKSIDWIFKRLRRPPLLWHLASSITIATVGFLSKVITGKKRKVTISILYTETIRINWIELTYKLNEQLAQKKTFQVQSELIITIYFLSMCVYNNNNSAFCAYFSWFVIFSSHFYYLQNVAFNLSITSWDDLQNT